MIAAVCLDAGRYLVSGTGVDAQFEISNVVGDGVGRNDFYGITAGKEIERQLSRARLRSRNDSCQGHNLCRGAQTARLPFVRLAPIGS